MHFNPAVKYISRRILVNKPAHCTFLQLFIYGKSMDPTRNSAGTKQCHEKSSFCIALTISILKNFRCRNIVISIVPKCDIVSYKVINGFKAVKCILFFPMFHLY